MTSKWKRRGRPTDYSSRFSTWARALARRGLSEKEIAKEIGIALSTLNEWGKKYPEFSDALKEGKSESDSAVENALFKRAVGYEYEEIRVIAAPESKNPSGKQKPMKIEKTAKHVPGDVGAMTLWLKNRRPDLWRDARKIEQELTGKEGGPVEFKGGLDLLKYSEEELTALAQLIAKGGAGAGG